MSRPQPVLASASILPAVSILATLLAQPAAAQVLEASSDATIRDRLCLGGECADDPSPQFVADGFTASLEINDFRSRIDFVDTSTDSFPNTNWAIQLNEPDLSIASGGTEYFAIHDMSAGTVPFLVRGAAPTNALYVAESGAVGLQTSMPQANLHIFDDAVFNEAIIRLEEIGATPYTWDIRANNFGFYVYDPAADTVPFQVRPGAPTSAIDIASNGNVGIGTAGASAPLEIGDDASFSFFRITAGGAAINKSVDVVFTQGPLGTGELRYNIVDGDGPEMRLNADGDMTLDGTLTTGGPTCSGGCDAVFTERRIIPEPDYAARMWADGHLPHVGPTAPGAPINVSEKLGGMLNALEHAHVFIERQNRRIETLEAEKAAQSARFARLEAERSAQAARLARLEARLSAIEAGARAD
ncbi:ABC transporter C-terminal domain-containing protein [Roseovarius sp.]|uniref:FtsB family cell division protein n=1 Tax=Roseovarius sp. TaxID=1486281 RepID=UPI00262D0740|nr:ABC transporter C-terminal domain-containing protein [Roseovarius sp.]MDM8168392.1 ABC transporter C-terminal domain-containing protein [Roseovarius sp.]